MCNSGKGRTGKWCIDRKREVEIVGEVSMITRKEGGKWCVEVGVRGLGQVENNDFKSPQVASDLVRNTAPDCHVNHYRLIRTSRIMATAVKAERDGGVL